jgi:hypothetical protein
LSVDVEITTVKVKAVMPIRRPLRWKYWWWRKLHPTYARRIDELFEDIERRFLYGDDPPPPPEPPRRARPTWLERGHG